MNRLGTRLCHIVHVALNIRKRCPFEGGTNFKVTDVFNFNLMLVLAVQFVTNRTRTFCLVKVPLKTLKPNKQNY